MANISYEACITRSMVRSNRNTLFVFGDNMEERGYGGQAAAMRGEPNTIGIPTKWRPERTSASYFTDADLNQPEVRRAIDWAFDRIEYALSKGTDVVIPMDGVGGGRAELPVRAPRVAAYIEERMKRLVQLAVERQPEQAGRVETQPQDRHPPDRDDNDSGVVVGVDRDHAPLLAAGART